MPGRARTRHAYPVNTQQERASMKPLRPITGYQGGKRRYACLIAERLAAFDCKRYYDIGAGSGAVTLALISLGVSPKQITTVDAGPWGWVWETIGKGEFDTMYLADLLQKAKALPPQKVKSWVESVILHEAPSPEIFLILQAASFGSAPVWLSRDGWKVGETGWRYCARSYWEPPPGSRERNPRGTIFSPDGMLETAKRVEDACIGLDGRQCRAETLRIEKGSAVYIDPPYEGTWGYGTRMDWRTVAGTHTPLIVSEGRALQGADEAIELAPRKEGAFKGKNRGRPEEWLSIWSVPIGC